jgi:hypothetical protein
MFQLLRMKLIKWFAGVHTLRKSIETKKLKGKMIDKAFRIKRDDLDKYIKKL